LSIRDNEQSPDASASGLFSVSKKVVVGATRGRPWILLSKIHRRKAKKGYFPSGNPKNFVFRRATEGRPYGVYEKPGSSTV
jgi:hypothetical protein